MKTDLVLIARRLNNGLRFPETRVYADPDDTRELLRHLADLARQYDRKVGRPRGWLREYDLIVRCPGRLEFIVAGNGTEIE
jgi:hypothetical protein